MADNVITPKFRVSYPNVFRARKNELSGKDEYSVVALFPKGADLSALKKSAQEAAKEKWGDKLPKNLRSPFRDQGEREKEGKLPEGYEEGAIFLNLKSAQRPGLVDGNRQPIIDENELYAGCYARAQVRAYAYEQKGNCGVAFGLQNLQKMADGDPLSSRVKAEDAFESVAGADNSPSSVF